MKKPPTTQLKTDARKRTHRVPQTSNALIYEKQQPCQKKPKGPQDNQSLEVTFRDNARTKPEKSVFVSMLLLRKFSSQDTAVP